MYRFVFFRVIGALFCSSLYGMTYYVTTNSPSSSMSGSLPNLMLSAASGDTIDCYQIAGQMISLTQPLPAITKNLTITVSTGSPVTIYGGNSYQAFSCASGGIVLSNFTVTNCVSAGGVGGGFGGGGGAGGGGAVYVHNGVSLTATTLMLTSNQAVGGMVAQGQQLRG